MKLTIDPEADVLYLRLNDAQLLDPEQVASGIVLDHDAHDNVVGVEMPHLSKRARKADLQRLLFEALGTSAAKQITLHETPPSFGGKADSE